MALSVSSTLYSPLICTSLLFGIPATVLNFAVGSMDRLEVERHFYVGSACQAIFDTLNGFSNTKFRGIRKNRIWKTLKKVEVLVSQSVPGQCWVQSMDIPKLRRLTKFLETHTNTPTLKKKFWIFGGEETSRFGILPRNFTFRYHFHFGTDHSIALPLLNCDS